MQTLHVEQLGIQYLQECLSYYTEQGSYYILYLAAILFLLIKGTKKERLIFIPSAVLLLLSVYNPVFPIVLNHFFDVNKEYYRFFWIAPVVIVVPYVSTRILLMLNDRAKRCMAAVIFLVIFCISGKFVYADGYVWAENRYKISNDLIKISEIIHGDADHSYPRALMEYHYNMEMRQYDPTILLTIDREDYLYAVSNAYTDEMLADEANPQYRLLAVLVRYQPLSDQEFIDALEATKTEYVVVSTQNGIIPFLERNGLSEVERTQTSIVYKYELKEAAVSPIIDYSELHWDFHK
ncbi:MAG: hypothetical protein GX567_05490 [Clostridia bacterium]|nr:hypothetical protein [Clostridia bacterium]